MTWDEAEAAHPRCSAAFDAWCAERGLGATDVQVVWLRAGLMGELRVTVLELDRRQPLAHRVCVHSLYWRHEAWHEST